MDNVFQGVLLGFTLSLFFSFGPVLFALIQTSILRGFWSSALLAFGVMLSDFSLIALGFFGAISLLQQSENQFIFGIVGGVVLIVMGFFTFTRKVVLREEEEGEGGRSSNPKPITYVLKGFFINFTNPFVWIFWMSVVVGFSANYEGETTEMFIFFASALGVVFLTDVLKSFSAYKIKKYLQTHSIIWVNRIAGVILALFGVYLIIRSLYVFYL